METWKKEFQKLSENMNGWKQEIMTKVNEIEGNVERVMNDGKNQIAKEALKIIDRNKSVQLSRNLSTPSGPSSNLRSRKRSRLDREATEECDDTLGINHVTNVPSYSEVLKRKAVNKTPTKRKGQVVIVKPKQIEQTSRVTKQALKEKVDRSSIKVQTVKEGNNGTVIIGINDPNNLDSVVSIVKSSMGDNYDVALSKPMKPRLKIVGLSEKIEAEELKSSLSDQNDDLKIEELKLVAFYENKYKEYTSYTVIVEVDLASHDMMLEMGRVNVGWERCRVFESINVMRCYKCCGYGHKSADCKSSETCIKCAGSHANSDCQSETSRCANCLRMNTERKTKLDTNHFASSNECPVYKRLVERKRQTIDYSL